MKRFLLTVAAAATLTVGSVGLVMADPNPPNPPTNPNACVGTSSTTANTAYGASDHDKLRSDQARQDDGQPGRADSVNVIPQCVNNGLDRGVQK